MAFNQRELDATVPVAGMLLDDLSEHLSQTFIAALQPILGASACAGTTSY
jgi:hypothetical protein